MPPFPTSVEDLAQWQVYADQLIERGEPLGSLLAYELSLGDSPSKTEFAAFHQQTNRLCRAPRPFRAGWILGHVKTLEVIGRHRPYFTRLPPEMLADAKELLPLRDFLSTLRCSKLESISFQIHPRVMDGKIWSEVMRRLPSSCNGVGVGAFQYFWSQEDVRLFLDALPSHVRRLECGRWTRWAAPFLVDARFEELDLRPITIDLTLARELAQHLELNPRVRVRLGSVRGRDSLEVLRPWAVLGAPGDAALVHEASGAIILLPRVDLERLQRRNGVITARAQLERSVPETHGFELREGLVTVIHGDQLVRHGKGHWTARFEADALYPQLPISIDGVAVEVEPVALRNDARVELEGHPYRFIERLSGT